MKRQNISLFVFLLFGCVAFQACSQGRGDKNEESAAVEENDKPAAVEENDKPAAVEENDKPAAVEKNDKPAAVENDESKDRSDPNDKRDAKEQDEREIKPLTIGSAAPALDIEHWVQDGNGEFGVVTELEENKVYVIEFWATWCGPCISSMPHLAELQERYADRDVQVVSISDENLETVETFLDREVRGADDGSTYRDLTSVYCLTTDPDGSSGRDYMRAAKRSGIPCAFIVGKKGHIEWIGHPMAIDDALEEVVTDQWDREAFAEEYIAQQEAREILTKLSRLMRSKKTDQAIELLDDYIANGKLESERERFKQIKFQVLASDQDYSDQAAEYAIQLLADDLHDASSANNLAWNIYLMAKSGRYEDERVTKAASQLAANKAKDAGESRAYLLDTVAHLEHLLGNSEQALQTQRRAMKAATADQKRQLVDFLNELEELQKTKEEDKAEANKEDRDGDKEGKADDDS